MHRCTTCDGWVYPDDNHICPPAWRCWPEDDPDYERTIHAALPSTAAEKFADLHDCESAEYSIVSGKRDIVVVVRKVGATEPAGRYAIYGEAVPKYTATRMTTPATIATPKGRT